MTLRGSAFLALWNDVDSERMPEYEDWHAVEHVPERVGIPGFLAGRRCVAAVAGSARRYFTFYELESLAALQSAAYAEVVDRPTDWSRSMRPSLRNVVRRACSTMVSLGAGGGRAVAVVELSVRAPTHTSDMAGAAAALQPLVDAGGIVGVHLGIEDEAAATTHPLHATWTGTAVDSASDRRRFVLLLEGTSANKMADVPGPAMSMLRQALGRDLQISTQMTYEVATWVERSHLAPSSGRQPPRPDRRRRWPAAGAASSMRG